MSDPRLSVLDPELLSIFDDDATIQDSEARARLYYPHTPFIIWEGDPTTFAFTYVGGDAESMLGFAAREWIDSPTFWADRVIHPEDRNDAIAYCALATGRKADHIFEYRAITRNQHIIWLRDYVRVVLGKRGIPTHLRGLMVDVSEEKWEKRVAEKEGLWRLPSLDDLAFTA